MLSLKHVLLLLLLGLMALTVGLYFDRSDPRTHAGAEGAAPRESTNVARELDFGFVELDPGGQAVAVPSFKNGGTMSVYAGDQFEFQATGDDPLPPIELRTGDTTQVISGSSGTVVISGPPKQPLAVALRAQGERHSLPGSEPPRVAVKIQVFGPTRPVNP